MADLDRTVLMTEVVVRLCHAEDLPSLEWFGMYTHHREIFASAFARQLRDENLMLVADLNGFPIGQAWLDLVRRRDEHVGYIWAVRVFPMLRGLGIGTLLMRSAERVLVTRGFHTAELGVEKDNPDARRFYERVGYSVSSSLVEEYGYTTPDGIKASHVVEQWLMQKKLEANG